MKIGEMVPDFAFNATNNVQGHLNDYKGQIIVLYFTLKMPLRAVRLKVKTSEMPTHNLKI